MVMLPGDVVEVVGHHSFGHIRKRHKGTSPPLIYFYLSSSLHTSAAAIIEERQADDDDDNDGDEKPNIIKYF